MCEKRKHFTSFIFTWNLSLPLLLMRLCSFSWFFPITLGWHYEALGNLQLQVPSHHSKSHCISASVCDTDTWFSFITFPMHLCHCKYSNQMSSALPLSKCQWNKQTNPGTPSLPRLPILALLFFARLQQMPHNRGSDKTKDKMQVYKGWPGHPLIHFKLCNGRWMLMEWISTYQHRSYVESVSLLGQDSLYKLV